MAESPDPRADPTGSLVARARAGDQEAWREINQRYRPLIAMSLHGRIPRPVRSELETEDLVQSTFMSACVNLEGFEYVDEPSFRAWLRNIAHSRLQDRLRAHARLRRNPASNGSGLEERDFDFVPGSAPSPSELVADQESQERLLEAITRLEDDEQSVLWLRFFERRSLAQVALELGCSEEAARARYNKALEALYRKLS